MKDFSALFLQLDQTTGTNAKVDALAAYFRQASDRDKLWTIALFSHRRPRRTVTTSLLRQWAAEYADVPSWLFEESYHVVGDLAETIALVLPEADHATQQPLSDWIDYIRSLSELEEEQKKEKVWAAWRGLERSERFIFNKLITGGFRMGVSQKLMVRALAQYTGIEENTLAHRLMGNWDPDAQPFEELLLADNLGADLSKPYPFFLAYPLEGAPEDLGPVSDWQAERKWDGIRGQLIVRKETLFVWSRGEELVTDKFPEFAPLASLLPDGIALDGEIMPYKDGRPLSFGDLQTRIGRKNVTRKVLDSVPVVLVAYDLLEWKGEDIRDQPLVYRRAKLEEALRTPGVDQVLLLSEALPAESWADLVEARAASRQYGSEGLMLKRKNSPYQSGRKKGDWWKWKIDPLTVDAVMIYAQRGHGRRANLFTDYTFAVWDGDQLVPFTKAYSGLTDQEFQEVTNWVRRHTLERFGPVHSVQPYQVFEIAFEGIQRSTRHKSGVALRFPRISRWRKDKPPKEANTLADLQQILAYVQGSYR